MGKKSAGYNRPIIANFPWYGDITRILSIKTKLPKGVFVKEDLPEVWEDKSCILRPYSKIASSMEMSTTLSKDKLIINGVVYQIDNLASIPDEIKAKISVEKQDEEKLVYFGPQSVFSNMHPCHFSVDNTHYNSVEQYFQSQKASFFDDDKIVAKILAASSPFEIKSLGKKVMNFDEHRWRSVAEQIMTRGVYEKFSQNAHLKQLLESTTKDIFESGVDDFWGTGIHIKNAHAMTKSHWKSEGLMHEVYKKVRNELLNPSP